VAALLGERVAVQPVLVVDARVVRQVRAGVGHLVLVRLLGLLLGLGGSIILN